MLKSVYLQNFKCYGSSGNRIDLAPLTFLYGDNSSGKSTFLQAINYLGKSLGTKAKEPVYDELRKHFKSLIFKNTLDAVIGIGVTLETRSGVVKFFRKIRGIGKPHIRYADSDIYGILDIPTPIAETAYLKTEISDAYDPPNASLADVKEAVTRIAHMEALRPRNSKYASSSMAEPVEKIDFDKEALNVMFHDLGISYEYLDPDKLRDTLLEIDVLDVDLGAGIHALKKILIAIDSLPNEGILLIEEPEAHLHPKYLGAFAKLLVDAVKKKPGAQIIVECHSEHILLKLRNLIRIKLITPDKISIIHIMRDADGSHTTAIKMDENGRFDRWPGGFFTERTQLLTENL